MNEKHIEALQKMGVMGETRKQVFELREVLRLLKHSFKDSDDIQQSIDVLLTDCKQLLGVIMAKSNKYFAEIRNNPDIEL